MQMALWLANEHSTASHTGSNTKARQLSLNEPVRLAGCCCSLTIQLACNNLFIKQCQSWQRSQSACDAQPHVVPASRFCRSLFACRSGPSTSEEESVPLLQGIWPMESDAMLVHYELAADSDTELAAAHAANPYGHGVQGSMYPYGYPMH